jgi:hypothetical protein
MQEDGNLVIFDAARNLKWSTATGGNSKAHLDLQVIFRLG